MGGLFGWLTDALFGKPPSTDYGAAAQAQGAANRETAIAQSLLNNPNIVSPYGSQIYTGPVDASGRATLTQTLSPAEKAKLDLTNAIQMQSLGLLGDAMPGIRSALLQPFGLSGSPAMGYLPGTGPGRAQTDANFGSAGPIQNRLDFSGLPGIPQASPDIRDAVSQSLFEQGARFLDPQFSQRQQQLDSMLANQGIQRGTEAFNTEQGNLDLSRSGAYNDLINRAISGGGDAMQQLYNMQLGSRQQGVGELTAQGQFANTAQQQAFQDILNAMQGRNAGIGLQGQLASNEAGLYNQGRGQALNELSTSRTLPLNMLTALMSGSQVNSPNFQPTQPTAIQPTPIMQGALAQGQQDTANYNMAPNLFGQILGAGTQFFKPTPSDRRLKSNIKRIGQLPNGLPLYSYTIFDRPAIGVMADEVEKVLPEAVSVHPSGYKMVDYSKLDI